MTQKRFFTITKGADLMPLVMLEEEFMREQEGLSEHTLKAYLGDLRVLREHFAEVSKMDAARVMFCDITRGGLESFVKGRSQVEAAATVARRLATAKSFCAFVAAKFEAHNPSELVKAPKVLAPSFKSLTKLEQEAVLAHAEKESVRDWFIVALILQTGLRVSEAKSITLGQLTEDRRWFVKVLGKGRKLRNVPISIELRRCLIKYMDYRKGFPTRPEYPLLVSAHGKRQRNPESYQVSNKSIYRICNRIMEGAGIREELAHPHTLRHTYARNVMQHIGKKISNPTEALVILKDLLGHSSIQTTMIYLENNPDEISALLEDIA